MVKYWTAQEILTKIEECKRDDPGDIISLDCTGTPEDEFIALFNIINCSVNKDYYNDVRVLRLGNLLVLEHKELEHLSGVLIEFEALVYITGYLYSLVNKVAPTEMPYENPKDMQDFIKRVKKKIGKDAYQFVISRCLSNIHLSRIMEIDSEETFEQELDIIYDAIESTRHQLTGKTRLDMEEYIHRKCSKLRETTKMKYDDDFEGPFSELNEKDETNNGNKEEKE